MGRTSKPLTIYIDPSLYITDKATWDTLSEQGHRIVLIDNELPDLYLAPYAMRVTSDMLKELPSTLALAMRGARDIKFTPQGDAGWKGKKDAKKKVSRKRKDTTVKVEATDGGEFSVEEVHRGPHSTEEGTGGGTVDTPPDDARVI